MKTVFLTLFLLFSFSMSQTILPISVDIMEELRHSYRSGEIDEYIKLVTRGQNLSEEDLDEISLEVEAFFESNQFIETGAQYLSALFTERELDEILTVLNDSSLRYDPNYAGAVRLEQVMNRLKPYIVKYLRMRSN